MHHCCITPADPKTPQQTYVASAHILASLYQTHAPYCTAGSCTVSVLGRDKGYTVKYSPTPEGACEGKAQENSQRRRAIFDRVSRVES